MKNISTLHLKKVYSSRHRNKIGRIEWYLKCWALAKSGLPSL